MHTRTYTETVTLQEETCIECGILFAMPADYIKTRQETGKSFYCPNGHSMVYGKGTATALREQLKDAEERARRLAAQLVSATDQLQATKKELQRHKKRTANGVCPCCNRSFVQLQRHMKTKHPEYQAEHEKG